MGWLYQAAFALTLLLAGPFLLVLRGRHYLPSLGGRLGLGLGRRIGRSHAGGLWIHAVSVGEVAVAATLARALPVDLPLVVTTVTPTGQERAEKALAGRAAVVYLPFDLAPSIQRFLEAARPRALLLVEGDYWPLLLRELARREVPVWVVNGRISDRTFPRLRLLCRLVHPLLFARVFRFGVQTALDRTRLLALGVPAERVEITGNLKFEAPAPPPLPELEMTIARLAGTRPLLLAGSTMPGEEESVLEAFALAGGPTEALLVIAPRHPERFDLVFARSCERFPGAVRRSSAASAADAGSALPPVVLLDSLGELATLYALARGAFIGGTLTGTGGHNPIEAARCGVPVVAGPSMSNFREIAESFDRASAWARATDAAELGKIWRRWLLDPEAAAEVGRRARDLVAANRGALERTIQLLAPLLLQLQTDVARASVAETVRTAE